MTVTEVDALFKPTSASIRQLFSDHVGGFSIPSYQRPYRWQPADMRRLCEDLVAGLHRLTGDGAAVTFIGAIITVSGVSDLHDTRPSDARQVIDGQQRLTTLLMLAIAIHERLGQLAQKVASDSNIEEEAREWCESQFAETRGDLLECLGQTKKSGDPCFLTLPKIIREISDVWSTKQAKARYVSPVANLLYGYLTQDSASNYVPKKPTTQIHPEAPGSSESDYELLHRRFGQMRALARDLSNAKEGDLADSIDLGNVLGASSKALSALFQGVTDTLAPNLRSAAASNSEAASALRLLFLGRFMLERVALTQINAKDESYAFDLFDSLNTTGEPLTAIETFLPLVVEAEGVTQYATSPSFEHMSLTSRLTAADDNVQRQTERLVTTFLLADAGLKVPSKHNDQRRELNKRYKGAENMGQRRALTRHLADCSLCYFHLWQRFELSKGATGVEDHLDDESLFALRFLNQINHTVVLGPLSRYFSHWVVDSSTESLSSLTRLIKASTAFSALWRTAHGGTDGIDGVYRKLMSDGVPDVCSPLARTNGKTHDVRALADVELVIAAYLHHLQSANKYGFSSKEEWISLAAGRPIYDEQPELSRFLLLVSAHHAVPDGTSGLTKDGTKGDHTNMLKSERYTTDDRLATVEHVAPQNPDPGTWPADLYTSPSAISTLGNLTLLPLDDNSFINNRTWQEKRYLYRALSAEAPDDATAILSAAVDAGMDISEDKRQFLIGRRLHLPVLQAVANYEEEWTRSFVELRTTHLYGRAWDVLSRWLTLE